MTRSWWAAPGSGSAIVDLEPSISRLRAFGSLPAGRLLSVRLADRVSEVNRPNGRSSTHWNARDARRSARRAGPADLYFWRDNQIGRRFCLDSVQVSWLVVTTAAGYRERPADSKDRFRIETIVPEGRARLCRRIFRGVGREGLIQVPSRISSLDQRKGGWIDSVVDGGRSPLSNGQSPCCGTGSSTGDLDDSAPRPTFARKPRRTHPHDRCDDT